MQYSDPTPPASLVDDFDRYITFLETAPQKLTATNTWLSRQAVFTLNQQMSAPEKDRSPRHDQMRYHRLHLFYYLARESGMCVVQADAKGGMVFVAEPERIAAYRALHALARYFFLLEVLWTSLPWEEILAHEVRYFPLLGAQNTLANLAQRKSGARHDFIQGDMHAWMTFRICSFPLLLEFFGFWTVHSEPHDKQSTRLRHTGLTLTDWGARVLPVLVRERPIDAWNQHQDEFDDDVDLLAGLLGLEPVEAPENAAGNAAPEREPFIAAFHGLFPPGALPDDLGVRPPGKSLLEGRLIFRVQVRGDKNVYREIECDAGRHTFDDLHDAIQSAFKFDNDHAYAFFLDSRRWSRRQAVWSPYVGDQPAADELKLGEISWYPKQKILYLFDFGDEWLFDVTVLEHNPDARGPKTPKVGKKVGRSPEQYPEWE